MKPWKIIITDGLAENGQEILRTAANVTIQTGISLEELCTTIHEFDAIIVRSRTKVTADLIAAGKKLRVIGRAGVGVDNIDLDAAREHGIRVVNAPNATTAAVAEHTLGLMLSLARFLPLADATMKHGQWQKKQLRGTELQGKTLGIIGVGRIGGAVSILANAVGMHVLGYDPYLTPDEIRSRKAEPVSKVQPLYDQSDYITYHVPLTEETYRIVNAESFSRMKPGVRIICTARGGVINEDDLLIALNQGLVSGAALDVFENEPPGKTALIDHPKLIATPHIGAQTEEAQYRVAIDIAEEVLAALYGNALRWQVA